MRGHYKEFDVLRSFVKWDERTQRLIKDRMASGEKVVFFSEQEQELLLAVLEVVLAEKDEKLLKRVAAYIGDSLGNGHGKGYRDAALPDEKDLFRKGLQGIVDTAHELYQGRDFSKLTLEEKIAVIESLKSGQGRGITWQSIDSKKFFKELLTAAVSSFYSQPEIWSEIGYAGPAYPRGYVRVELGGQDPWEARKND
ncbi:MAG: gluconate 2-dehydrogenase subunit 3 family protein [Bacillota bacterium]